MYGDKTVFVNNKNVVVVGCKGLVGDNALHDEIEVTAASGSPDIFIYNIKLHRHDDLRECGATTVVEGQDTVLAN